MGEAKDDMLMCDVKWFSQSKTATSAPCIYSEIIRFDQATAFVAEVGRRFGGKKAEMRNGRDGERMAFRVVINDITPDEFKGLVAGIDDIPEIPISEPIHSRVSASP